MHAAAAATTAIAALLLLAACGGEPTDADREARTRAAIQQTRNALAERAATLADAPREQSPTQQLNLEIGRYPVPPAMMALTPGRIARGYPFENEPRAILVANDGSLIVATRRPFPGTENTLHVIGPENDVSFPYASPDSVNSLHWNADGTAFIATAAGVGIVHSWPPDQSGNSTRLENTSARRVIHAATGDEIHLLEDMVDFGATTQNLVAWNVAEHLGEDSSDPIARAIALSTLGTFPQLGITWGHPRQPWRIFPDNAPIWELSATYSPQRQLTFPGDDVDIRPQAARDGRLWFVRAPRQILSDAGGAGIAPNARAWTATVAGDGEQMVTAEPTLDVAVSPDGSKVAFLVAREGKLVALVDVRDAILARDLTSQRTASQDFRSRMKEVADGVEAAFLLTNMATREMEETPMGPIPTVAPDERAIALLGSTLRQQLEEQFDLVLEPGVEKLGVIDGLLAEGDGLWTESPAIVAAIAGVYAEALREEEPAIEWYLDLARPDLSYNLDEATFLPANLVLGPEGTTNPLRLRVQGIAQLHSPFYVARERLAGRLALDGAAREVLGNRARPILLVENFDAGNLNIALATYAERAGLDLTGEDMDTFARAVSMNREDTLANLAIYLVSSQQRIPELALASALNLAETITWSADPLLLVIEPLFWIGQYEQGLEIAELAVQQAPQDPHVLFDVALAYYDDLDYDAAEDYLDRANEADDLGELATFIERTRTMIADSRLREAEDEQEDEQ